MASNAASVTPGASATQRHEKQTSLHRARHMPSFFMDCPPSWVLSLGWSFYPVQKRGHKTPISNANFKLTHYLIGPDIAPTLSLELHWRETPHGLAIATEDSVMPRRSRIQLVIAFAGCLVGMVMVFYLPVLTSRYLENQD